jgi:DnaK suppressor protein
MMPDVHIYRERLQAELKALILDITEADSATDTVELDQTRIGRLSRMDAMQQQAMARNTQARYGIRRQQVEAALARVEAGTYGRCCLCREVLTTARLEADPAVVFCADCAAERELG